jgi:hypothetical protein
MVLVTGTLNITEDADTLSASNVVAFSCQGAVPAWAVTGKSAFGTVV